MRILIFSPIELPYTLGARYTGLERLAVQFAEQWHLLGNDVTLLAHKDTTVPEGVRLLPCDGYETIDRTKGEHAEVKAFMRYQPEFYSFDVIWDIGHLHLIARMMSHLPTVNVLPTAPEYAVRAGNIKAPYNLVSFSRWGIDEIRKYFHQESRYQETIMVDPEIYKPLLSTRSNRFLTLGRMSEEKGNLNAVMLCRNLGLSLDIAGGRGSETTASTPQREYEQRIIDLCDGSQIKFYGEVSDEQKIELMQTCRGLIYMTNHVEITSHKIQEALLAGAPAIVPNLGGIPEIITHGVDGYLCSNEREYVEAIKHIDELDPSKTRKRLTKKYHPKLVAEEYFNLFEQVKGGLRWK